MSVITDETLAAVKKLAREYNAVQELASALESVGDLELVRSKITSDIARLNGEKSAATQELGDINAKIEGAREGLKEVEMLAENTRSKALDDSDATRKKANADAVEIIAAANNERRGLEADILKLKAEKEEKQKEVDKVTDELKALTSSLDKKKAEIRALAG